jgi:hypothetical protein
MTQVRSIEVDVVLEASMCAALMSRDYTFLAYADHDGFSGIVTSTPIEKSTLPNYAIYLGTTNTLQNCPNPIQEIEYSGEDLQANTTSEPRNLLTAYKLPEDVKTRAAELLNTHSDDTVFLLKDVTRGEEKYFYVLLCMNMVFEDECVICMEEDIKIDTENTDLEMQPCIVSCRHVFYRKCIREYDEEKRKVSEEPPPCPTCMRPLDATAAGELVCNGTPNIGFSDVQVELDIYYQKEMEYYTTCVDPLFPASKIEEHKQVIKSQIDMFVTAFQKTRFFGVEIANSFIRLCSVHMANLVLLYEDPQTVQLI